MSPQSELECPQQTMERKGGCLQMRVEPQNWLVLPAPHLQGQPAPGEQEWLVTVSGIATVDFTGNSTSAWRKGTIDLEIDLHRALATTGRQAPPNFSLHLQVRHWANLATLNSIYDQATAVDAGFAVDAFSLRKFGTTDGDPPFLLDPTGERLLDVFRSLNVEVAARDNDAVIHRIGYHLMLVGTIVVGRVQRFF